MGKTLYDEGNKLDLPARIRLAQDILESVANELNAPPLPNEQRAELRARLEHHRRHPDEQTWTLEQIKANLGTR